MARRKKRVKGRRAWFKVYSQKKYTQPDAYGIGVLYGKKSIPLDKEIRQQMIADGDYTSGLTYTLIQEQRKVWGLSLTRFEKLEHIVLQNGKYEKIKLYFNGERFVFARERYSHTDLSPVSLVKSVEYRSRDAAMSAWTRGRILWIKCLYPSPIE